MFCNQKKRMAQNSRMSRVASKDDEFTFCWKVFTGWDYMIGNSETAYNKVASLVMSLKESILEEKERKKEERNWKLFAIRIFTNILFVSFNCFSIHSMMIQIFLKPFLFNSLQGTVIISIIGLWCRIGGG